MVLIPCYECEKEISDKAPACPHCGAPKEEQLEEADILESVAVENEPALITQNTASSLPTEPESVATKDEPFNKYVAIAVGAFVCQIGALQLGIARRIASPVYSAYGEGPSLMVSGLVAVLLFGLPSFLLIKFGKKQSRQFYTVTVLAGVGVMSIAIVNTVFGFGALAVFLIVVMTKAGILDGRNGPYEMYHENGQLKEKGNCKDGKQHGLAEEYYENGQLRVKGNYNMDQKCGEWIEDGETKTYDPCPPDLEDGN